MLDGPATRSGGRAMTVTVIDRLDGDRVLAEEGLVGPGRADARVEVRLDTTRL